MKLQSSPRRKILLVTIAVLVGFLLSGRYMFGAIPTANAQVSSSEVYKGIQAAQDYLTRLEKNTGTSFQTESEFMMLPLSIEWGDGCFYYASNGADNHGSNTCGEPSSIPSISATTIGQTSETYVYDFSSPVNWNCNGFQPDLQLTVTRNWQGMGTNGPVFNIDYTVTESANLGNEQSSTCTYSVFIGPYLVALNIVLKSNVGTHWGLATTMKTYSSGGGGSSNGFDFNPYTSTGVLPSRDISSFRYTTRSGMQGEFKWAYAAEQPTYSYNTGVDTLAVTARNELVGATPAYTIQDVLTPTWFWGESQPTNFEDNSNTNGGPYTDCQSSGSDPGFPYGWNPYIGIVYPYQSKACLNVSAYLGCVWGEDPETMALTAIQTLNTRGPTAADVYWRGSDYSPISWLAEINTEGWINTGYGVYYPSVNYWPWDWTTQCPATLSPENNPAVYSIDRTASVAQLATLLAYKYGQTQFQTMADDLIKDLLNVQWGMDTSAGNNNCVVGCGKTVANGQLFRPDETGGFFGGWNSNWAFKASQPSIFDNFNMPNEFVGEIATGQEATQEGLATLLTYYNLVTDPSGNTLNNGIQPFDNFVFDNTGGATETRTFSTNGIYSSSASITVSINLVNEGDGYLRNFYVYLDGSQIYSSTVSGSVDNGQTISIGLGQIGTGTHTLGIKLTTNDYKTPYDWWIVDAALHT